MNKLLGIIGAIIFALAVAVGYFAHFSGDALVQIALATFGLVTLVAGAIKGAKESGKVSWKVIASVVLAVAGGVLCALGGLAESIFATVSGAVVALLAVIFGIVFASADK